MASDPGFGIIVVGSRSWMPPPGQFQPMFSMFFKSCSNCCDTTPPGRMHGFMHICTTSDLCSAGWGVIMALSGDQLTHPPTQATPPVGQEEGNLSPLIPKCKQSVCFSCSLHQRHPLRFTLCGHRTQFVDTMWLIWDDDDEMPSTIPSSHWGEEGTITGDCPGWRGTAHWW